MIKLMNEHTNEWANETIDKKHIDNETLYLFSFVVKQEYCEEMEAKPSSISLSDTDFRDFVLNYMASFICKFTIWY